MAEQKYSIDKEFELEDLRKQLSALPEKNGIRILICEEDDRRATLELKGDITRDELLRFLDERRKVLHVSSQKDELTGVLNHDYFEKRLQTIDRSEVLPVAIINFNINDWKFVNDHFGDEESDRLIRMICDVIVGESKPYFVIGRMDGDVFGVLIPRASEREAELYIESVKDSLSNIEDRILAPSVAAGLVTKTSIYEKIEDLMSDAEYNMFDDKYRIKNAPGYRERLEHGL